MTDIRKQTRKLIDTELDRRPLSCNRAVVNEYRRWTGSHWKRTETLNAHLEGVYAEPRDICPFCGEVCTADWVDIGVGSTQCGPYHCEGCGASEVGPNDDVTDRATQFGWYLPGSPAGSSVNTVDGKIVDHETALDAYRAGTLDPKSKQLDESWPL